MTATITEEEVDTDWMTVLDFDHAIPCVAEHDIAAKWKVVVSCCGHPWFLCQAHFDFILDKIGTPGIVGMECPDCLNISIPPSSIIALAERI